MATHQNIQNLGAGGMYGTNTSYGGGGVPVARSELDFLRLGVGRQPSAEYPDGYLGTIRTRRDDRGRPGSTSENVLDSLKTRIGQRAYQRGVHRGERIDASDYYYPEGLDATRGIVRQMEAVKTGNTWSSKRNTIKSELVPAPHLPNDGKSNLQSTSPAEINQRRAQQLGTLKPNWR
jgi:hypothetical protein